MTKSCVSCTLRPQSNKQGSLPSCEAFVLPELRVELVLSQGAPPPLSLLGQVRLGHTPPPQLFEQSRRRPLQLPAIMSVTSACKQYCKSLYMDCAGFILIPGGGAGDCSFVPGCFLFLTFWLLCTDLMRTVIDAEQREDKSKALAAFRRRSSSVRNAKSWQTLPGKGVGFQSRYSHTH